MTVQAGLCQTWSKTLKTGFLASRLKFQVSQRTILIDIPVLTATGSREFSRSMTGSSVISEAILRAICSMSSPNSCAGATSCLVLGMGGKAEINK